MRPLLLLLLFAVAALVVALMTGSVPLSPLEVWHALWGTEGGLEQAVVVEIRLPRAVGAFAVGALLALSGVLMQALLGNPLADPYILGVSGGASAGMLLALLLGLGGMVPHAAALGGALLSILLVFHLAGRGRWNVNRLLLTGVVVAAGWGAGVSLLLSLSGDNTLRGAMFWLLGDLSQVHSPWAALAIALLGLAATLPAGRALNLMARGELHAATLGVSVGRLNLHLYITASLLTATAVTVGGNIGFVGLVIPHLLRLALGSDHRILIPASLLCGGGFLVLADTLARTLIAPQQLPVGVLTALLGVPAFLYLMARLR